MCEQHIPRRMQGVCGISTRKVYPRTDLHRYAVRSYRTFSPLSRRNVGTVIFCDPVCAPVPITRKPEPHPLGGAVLCVVRTFLPIPIPKCWETGGRAVCSFFIPIIDGIVFLAFPMGNRSVGTKNRFETSGKRQEFLIPDLLLA